MRSVNYGNATIQQTAIDVANAALQTIAAPLAGSRVIVLAVDLVAAGAMTVKWQNDPPTGSNTDIGGARTLTTGVPYVLSSPEYGFIRSALNNGLQLLPVGAVQLSGTVTWVYSNDTVDC